MEIAQVIKQGIRTQLHLVKLQMVEVEIELEELNPEVISGPEYVGSIIQKWIGRKDREHFVVLHMNAKNQVISAEVAAIGSLTNAIVHPREIFKSAILQNAAGIICGHNHPSGSLVESKDDITVLDRLKNAAEVIGIELLDYLVVNTRSSRSLIHQESQV